MSAQKLLRAADDPKTRREVYDLMRRRHPGVAALCAFTASEYLMRAGLLPKAQGWTANLAADMRAAGFIRVEANSAATRRALQDGDVVFTVDQNANGAPDHVYILVRWLDRERMVCSALDNYHADPAPRNVGPAAVWNGKRLSRGAAVYALRAPAGMPAVDVEALRAAARVCFAATPERSPAMGLLNTWRKTPEIVGLLGPLE